MTSFSGDRVAFLHLAMMKKGMSFCFHDRFPILMRFLFDGISTLVSHAATRRMLQVLAVKLLPRLLGWLLLWMRQHLLSRRLLRLLLLHPWTRQWRQLILQRHPPALRLGKSTLVFSLQLFMHFVGFFTLMSCFAAVWSCFSRGWQSLLWDGAREKRTPRPPRV